MHAGISDIVIGAGDRSPTPPPWLMWLCVCVTDMLDLDDAEGDGIANEVCAQMVMSRIAVRRTRRGADGRARVRTYQRRLPGLGRRALAGELVYLCRSPYRYWPVPVVRVIGGKLAEVL